MSLNPLYMPAPSLQEGFIDKSTGFPLSFGLVYFYSDVNRSTLKPIFRISGQSPNFNYIQLPNPVVLSGIGTIQDGNGNDVIPYYYPFVNSGPNAGNVELYFIEVYDQFGVLQFTREGFPNEQEIITGNLNSSDNLIPNGQFLLNNPPASFPSTKYVFDYGAGVVNNVIDIAPGGWTYQVSSTSTSNDSITFNQLLASNTNPSSSPRYEVRIVRSTPSADRVCDLRIRFMDVNKLQGIDTENGTWSLIFNANAASDITQTNVLLIKYFGTSGSSPSVVDATTESPWSNSSFTLTAGEHQYIFANIDSVNTGKTIGNNNNDFIEFAIRFNSTSLSVFDVRFTDFMLINDDLSGQTGIVFPQTTNGKFLSDSLFNIGPATNNPSTTNYYQEDGSNLYLPMVMTKAGMTYDFSEIGNIVAKTSLNNFTGSISNIGNELLCDGSQYPVNGYSPLGIPYKRLFSSVFSSGRLISPYGNGASYVNAFMYPSIPTQMVLMTNKPGSQPIPFFGSINPGFTYDSNTSGGNTIYANAWANNIGYVQVRNAIVGSVSPPVSSVPSKLTVFATSDATIAASQFEILIPGNGSTFATGGAAVNVTFTTVFPGPTTNTYSFWIQTGTESPSGSGIQIPVNINTSMSPGAIAAILANTINTYQTNLVTVYSLPPQSSSFIFTANGTKYEVWYNINNAGATPTSGNYLIQVPLVGTETLNQVVIKTVTAINSQFFATPDLRGLFLRGQDPFNFFDGFNAERASKVYNGSQFDLNTFEVDYFRDHTHTNTASTPVNIRIAGGNTPNSPLFNVTVGTWQDFSGSLISASTTVAIAETGFYETRPVNSSVAWVIKY